MEEQESINTERRRVERIPVKLKAEILIGSASYEGTVNDLSVCGIQIRSSSPRSALLITEENPVELKLMPISGDEIHITCKVIWAQINKIPIKGISSRMGLEVLELTQEYTSLVKSLTK